MLGNITWLLKQIVEKLSSNINEVIRQVFNFLLFFTKRFYTHKKHKTAYSKQK